MAKISTKRTHIVSYSLSESSFTRNANPTIPTRINKVEMMIIGIGRFFIIDQFILFLQRTGLAEAGVSFQDLQKLGLIGENEGSDQYHLHKAFIIPLKINP